MKLTVPANWQFDLLEKLDQNKVDELYGKLEKDFVGGGRASVLLPSIGREMASRYIKSAHKKGIKFNYLLNASCLGNKEWSLSGQRKIRKLLDWLAGIEVDSITVTVPYLLQLLKKCYPGFKVYVSVMAGVNSPLKARYWQDFGADQITLSFTEVNRNFELLRLIRKAVSCRLQLIANLQCLHGCPLSSYHGLLSSHASQSGDPQKGFLVDYCSLVCRHIRLKEPWKIISAGWIRPEDLHYYRDSGIDSIKLVDRIMKTDVILRIVEAYAQEKYDGNLMDLITLDKNRCLAFSKTNFLKKALYFFRPFKADLLKLYQARSALCEGKIFLDNSKLKDFLGFFVEGKCRNIDCADCGYCFSVAEKALSFDDLQRRKQMLVNEKALDALTGGSIFYQRCVKE